MFGEVNTQLEANQRIAIIGAGRGQLGLYQAAHELGLEIISVTSPGDNLPGVEYAHKVAYADISDPEAVLKALSSIELDGVATSCADTGLESLAAVAEYRNLPGISKNAAILSGNKLLMKKAFLDRGVSSAKFTIARSKDDLKQVEQELSYPMIVKALDLQGSQGITIVHDTQQLVEGFDHAMSLTKEASVIVEEFIVGIEFGAQALVFDGDIQFVLLHNDETFSGRTAVPVGHSVPFAENEAISKIATEEVIKAIQALELDNCAVNVDLIMDGEKPYLIELTGRAGANGLPEMVSEYFGLNYYSVILDLALGRDLDVAQRQNGSHAVAVRMLYTEQTGRLEGITIPDHDSIKETKIFRKPGDKIRGFKDSSDCIGQVVVASNTLDECFEVLEKFENDLNIQVEAQ